MTGEALRLFVRERLAHLKAPREVVILESLPTSGMGKVQKQVLRRL